MNVKCALLSASGLTGLALAGPLAAQTPPAEPEAVQPESPPQTTPVPEQSAAEEEIVVTGYRRSLETAQQLKRNSDGIVDAIVAEDIGKLPDTFASAALARVPGVQVTRAAGEAADVQVRGLPDISTTYNGREIFTAELRNVAIQDFPAGTVAALEVYKSSTANLIEGGIGGQVNVRGRRPFDFDGFELSGSLNGVRWEQSDGLTWNGNLLVSERWDTGIGEIGILANVSYVGLDFLDSTREQSLVIATAGDAQTDAAPGFRYPDAQALYYGSGERWRPSANASIQWRPTSNLEFYIDGLFQGFRSRDTNRFMFVPIFGDALQLTNVVLQPNGRQAQSMTVTGANRPDGFYASVNAKTDTYQVAGGGVYENGGLRISADVAYTDTQFDLTSANIDYAFASSPVRNVDFNVDGPRFDYLNFDLSDPANFISRGLFQENLLATGDDIQSRLDAEYDFGEGSFLRAIQLGVRYNDRNAGRRRGTSYINNEGDRIPLAALPVELGLTHPGFVYDDDFDERTFVDIPSDSIRDNLPALRTLYGMPEGFPEFSPLETFSANEKALAGYAQAKYEFDLGGMTVDGLVGVRVIRTKTTVNGTSRVIDAAGETFVPVTQENEYTDVLPNASARLRLTDDLQLRLAYTQTRTRPGFPQLNPSLTINPQQGSDIRTANGGNPDLTPLLSDNYDVSLEYYFSRTGSASIALFRHDATGFIQDVTSIIEDPVYGALRVTRPENLGDSRIQGAEVSFVSFLDFDFVPQWARGFGIQANGTYIDGTGELSPTLAATAPGDQRLVRVSKWAYNLVGLYETPTFSARLAYNYRSAYPELYSIEPQDPTARAVIQRGRGQLDFSATVTPDPRVTIAFDIANLAGGPIRRYRQFTDDGLAYPRQIIYLERTYSLGVRFRF